MKSCISGCLDEFELLSAFARKQKPVDLEAPAFWELCPEPCETRKIGKIRKVIPVVKV
jgi:hypothetical protein